SKTLPPGHLRPDSWSGRVATCAGELSGQSYYSAPVEQQCAEVREQDMGHADRAHQSASSWVRRASARSTSSRNRIDNCNRSRTSTSSTGMVERICSNLSVG